MNKQLGSTLVIAQLAVLGLPGCAVGPDFVRPARPNTSSYTAQPLPARTAATADVAGGEAQYFHVGEDIPALWWTLFQSQELNDLVQQGLRANPSIEAAQAALKSAEEHLRAEQGNFFPFVTGNAGSAREQSNTAAFGTYSGPKLYSAFNASVSVSYNLDLFGGVRRTVEVYKSQAQYAKFQLRGTALVLTTNVVTTAVRNASLQAQIEATEEIVEAETHLLNLTRQMFSLGQVSLNDVLAQQAALDQERATLPPLKAQLEQNRDALAVLVGRLPSENDTDNFRLDDLHLPDDLPLSIPSKLVEQRPDIGAEEALMRAANARIGVATANELPQLSLSGAYGGSSNGIGQLFANNYSVWGIGANLMQPIFEGGKLIHERRAAVADYKQAAAEYRQTVLGAFQNVADVLHALDQDAELVRVQNDAEQAAKNQLELTRQQYKYGATNVLYLLNAERTEEQTRIGLIQARAARYTDTATLFQALGGGWWSQPALAQASSP